jgi:hypothetical protein
VTKEKQEMESMTRAFFQDLYTVDPSVCSQSLIQLVQPKITEEINSDLCKDFSKEEISDALF